jgi:osmotically-inducible protein OsmY
MEAMASTVTGDILIIAAASRAEQVARALEPLAVVGRPVGSVEEAKRRLTADTVAIAIAPMDEASPDRASLDQAWPEAVLERLSADPSTAELPVLVVVDGGFDDARARRLYEAGAAVVIEWPAEVLFIPPLVLELRDVSVAARRSQPADVSLGEVVNARIAADESLTTEIHCRVIGDTAIVRGEVDSLWRVRRIRDVVQHVPGIEHVDTHGLHVVPPAVPDEELGRTVRDVIRSAMGDAIAKVHVSTHAGEVTLTGTLPTDAGRRQLESVVENVLGVTRIDDRIVVPADAADAPDAPAQSPNERSAPV